MYYSFELIAGTKLLMNKQFAYLVCTSSLGADMESLTNKYIIWI